VNLFKFNALIEEIVGTKPLQNAKNTRSHALSRIEKADNALKTYPFADISPDLTLKINPRAKRMALRLDPKKRIINLVVPKRGSMRQAYLFAFEHKYWIREKLAELPSVIEFTHGTTIPLLGQDRVINITYDTTLKKTDITLKNNELLVSTNKENPVKDTASRWGSCSQDGKLSYSWRLIFAPLDALDYVVAHEVAHLCHMDHSPDFWHVCEDLSANYSKGKSWMKRHSGELIRYG